MWNRWFFAAEWLEPHIAARTSLGMPGSRVTRGDGGVAEEAVPSVTTGFVVTFQFIPKAHFAGQQGEALISPLKNLE
ncbi:MAG: hypothetical protein DWH91_17070 [Planctomycetota bacterium]|nr:MAG: hypothetical protein DWH91_17070 [Planctomycetota bacterium]